MSREYSDDRCSKLNWNENVFIEKNLTENQV